MFLIIFSAIFWFKLSANVPRLCEGWVLEALSFKLAQSLIEFLMLNLALQPSFCKTAVGGSYFFVYIFVFVCLSHSSYVIIPNSGFGSPSKIEINSKQCPSGSSK